MGTGTVNTPAEQQKWLWLDGTSPDMNKYEHWAKWPGLGNQDGQGNRFYEPNNQRTIKSKGMNVRHAIFNQPEGGYKGFWYDKPSETMAHAVCEVDPKEKGDLTKLLKLPKGWETQMPLVTPLLLKGMTKN